MDQKTQQLVLHVADGNPGALLVIRRLMYFAMWYPVLDHLKTEGLIGSRLWQVVKDDYRQNWMQFGMDQLMRMRQGVGSEAQGLGQPVSHLYN